MWSQTPGTFFHFHWFVHYCYKSLFLPANLFFQPLFITAYCAPGLEIYTSLSFWACTKLNRYSVSQFCPSFWLMASALIQLPQVTMQSWFSFSPPLLEFHWLEHPGLCIPVHISVIIVYMLCSMAAPPKGMNGMLLNLLVSRIVSIHKIHDVNSAGGGFVHRLLVVADSLVWQTHMVVSGEESSLNIEMLWIDKTEPVGHCHRAGGNRLLIVALWGESAVCHEVTAVWVASGRRSRDFRI